MEVKYSEKQFEDVYHLTEELGRGEYGVVYRCVHKDNGQQYAVKALSLKKNRIDWVLQEIRICSRLDHVNVVSMVEDYAEENVRFVVFEYVAGGELMKRIALSSTYSELDACNFLEQILKGIAYIHSKDIIHRDLKPGNILLTGKEKDAVVKIADFGSAMEIDPKERSYQGFMGTPFFMSPEMFQEVVYGKPVDMWACGVILYVMLLGHPPFKGSSVEELIDRITNGVYYTPEELEREPLSDEAMELINRMLDIDQRDRITAEDALEHSFLKDRETVAGRMNRRNTITQLLRLEGKFNFKTEGIAVMASRIQYCHGQDRRHTLPHIPQISRPEHGESSATGASNIRDN